MRGVQTFIVGLFTLSAMVLVMGLLLEPIASFVSGREAMQAMGYLETIDSIEETILRWVPLLFIGYLLTWMGMWAFRRGRTTGVQRR